MRADMERAKAVQTFFDLIKMDENGLKAVGVKSEAVRAKILDAVSGWMDKYRFPGMFHFLACHQ